MQLADHLPVLRTLIDAPGTNDSVKLSAIAALGDFLPSLEDSEKDNDLQLLRLLAEGNTKFKYAAQAALNR